MGINLLKAIKSTHRNPVSKILHLIGLSLYVIGFILITGYYSNNLNISSPIYGIVLFPIAVGLFLLGHKKEGNLRAMTIIVIMKYLISKLVLIKAKAFERVSILESNLTSTGYLILPTT